jgi:hypothetical protein
MHPAGEDFPVTEVKPADDFGMMAAQAWIRAWWYGRRKQGDILLGVSLPHTDADAKYRCLSLPCARDQRTRTDSERQSCKWPSAYAAYQAVPAYRLVIRQ